MASLNLTLGAVEIGVLISSLLFGVTTVQVYNYHSSNFKDPRWIRMLVYGVWVLECIHTILLWVYLYRVTVTFYGNPVAIAASPWELSISALFNGMLDGLVQAYFAYKIWIISGKIYITLISWTGSFVHLGFNTALAGVASTPNQTLAVVQEKFGWILTVTLVMTFATDIVNTSSLCYFLYTKRGNQPATNKMVEKLIVWTIETGLMTTIAAMLMVITSLANPDTALWVAISVFYAKFYSNSLLVSLNRRTILRQAAASTGGVHSLSSSGHSSGGRKTTRASAVRLPQHTTSTIPESIELSSGVRVQVDTTTDEDRDAAFYSQTKFADP